jgi:uncharacterized protein
LEKDDSIIFQNLYILCTFGKRLKMAIVGRQEEQIQLKHIVASDTASFVAVYGRRRVGKTFLIKEYFNQRFTFYTTGLAKGNTTAQLQNFYNSLQEYFSIKDEPPQDWMEAFKQLKKCLLKVKGRKIIFIDELPWLDTAKSDFLMALEHFWNSWASTQKKLKLIVCGSAASWIINELLNNTGGLYNRVTHSLKILPFTLAETEQFFRAKSMVLTQYQIARLYMVLGGIPYYLEQVRKGESDVQATERLCFTQTGMMRSEFEFIFKSIFKNWQKHELIVRKIYELGRQATRSAIAAATGIQTSGDFTRKLNELEESGFIASYVPFGLNVNKKIYVVTDYFVHFHFKFIAKTTRLSKGFWAKQIKDASVLAWQGFAWERICFDHTEQIKNALGIQGMYSEASPWRYAGSSKKSGAQIDLVIDRKDNTINLCEIKFSENPYAITKQYDLQLRNKQAIFIKETKTKKAIFTTMITTFGLVDNAYAQSFVQSEVSMQDLFSVE